MKMNKKVSNKQKIANALNNGLTAAQGVRRFGLTGENAFRAYISQLRRDGYLIENGTTKNGSTKYVMSA